mmetsp:Transcript_106546/g.343773  ORF Transcript_106546/g.343773 Transcript_106546/m.343773 type:complete len:132 (+) Transcript_106546:172-567(+)
MARACMSGTSHLRHGRRPSCRLPCQCHEELHEAVAGCGGARELGAASSHAQALAPAAGAHETPRAPATAHSCRRLPGRVGLAGGSAATAAVAEGQESLGERSAAGRSGDDATDGVEASRGSGSSWRAVTAG